LQILDRAFPTRRHTRRLWAHMISSDDGARRGIEGMRMAVVPCSLVVGVCDNSRGCAAPLGPTPRPRPARLRSTGVPGSPAVSGLSPASEAWTVVLARCSLPHQRDADLPSGCVFFSRRCKALVSPTYPPRDPASRRLHPLFTLVLSSPRFLDCSPLGLGRPAPPRFLRTPSPTLLPATPPTYNLAIERCYPEFSKRSREGSLTSQSRIV
jgi:hypothetical protein